MSNISTHILNLVSSYTIQEISETEFDELQQWIQASEENKILFTDFLKVYKKSRKISFASSINKEKAWQRIVSKLETPLEPAKTKVVLLSNSWFKYVAAAIVIGVLSTSYFFRNSFINNEIIEKPIVINTEIQTGTDKATLTLEDGSVVVLQKGNQYKNKNITSNDKQIVYNENHEKPTKNAYHYLTIPRGGQFYIKLADGTQVWLNSESQLKFPIAFTKGKTREVELVYGEAYFNVSPSALHKGAKFKVMNKSQEVTVLGTEFNIKAYIDESTVSTTLVEGKVTVKMTNKSQHLLPNQQLNINTNTNDSEILTVDVYNEISWKDGVFSFKKKSLEEIMKVLSRWYDLDVRFENVALKKTGFNGTLGKDQNIEDILESIKSYGVIKGYNVNNKTVILK